MAFEARAGASAAIVCARVQVMAELRALEGLLSAPAPRVRQSG